MAENHYVARTYLKHFADDTRNGRLNAYRKSDRTEFQPWPGDVCREWDGDKNPVLRNANLLGEFRQHFEKQWNHSVQAFLTKSSSSHDKFVVAGYLANLLMCTPTAIGMASSVWRGRIRQFATVLKALYARGGSIAGLAKEDVEAIGTQITLITSIDWVKAVHTFRLVDVAFALYDCDRIVFRCSTPMSFITSDNPVVSLPLSKDVRYPSLFLPISPALGVCAICRSVKIETLDEQELKSRLQAPGQGGTVFVNANQAFVTKMNLLQIQSAAELVFSWRPSEWISNTIEELRPQPP